MRGGLEAYSYPDDLMLPLGEEYKRKSRLFMKRLSDKTQDTYRRLTLEEREWWLVDIRVLWAEPVTRRHITLVGLSSDSGFKRSQTVEGTGEPARSRYLPPTIAGYQRDHGLF